RKRLIDSNPFADQKTVMTGKDKPFITREMVQKVMDKAPDDEWKLIIALSRFGGLRCPSEVLAMQIADVNWEESKITVRSCKTEHHPGKATRLIPLFPELESLLLTACNEAEPGDTSVIRRHRLTDTAMREMFGRIV